MGAAKGLGDDLPQESAPFPLALFQLHVCVPNGNVVFRGVQVRVGGQFHEVYFRGQDMPTRKSL